MIKPDGFSTRARRIIVTGVAAAGACLSIASTYAAEPLPQVSVYFTRVDFATQKRVQELYLRLQRASRAVCRHYETRNVRQVQLRAQCFDTALGRAVEEVGSGALSSLHASRPSMRLADQQVEAEPKS
jgi:UrcA family protein